MPVPRIPHRPGTLDFFRGLALPFAAARLMARTPALRRLSWACAGVIVCSLVALLVLLARYTGPWLEAVLGRPAEGWGRIGWELLRVVAFAVLFAVGANTVPLLLLAPLQDPLSEATEAAVGAGPSRPFSWRSAAADAARSLGHTVARIALLLAGHAALLILHLVPGIGGAVWTVLAGGWTFLWIAGEYLDAPMSRHGRRFAEVRRTLFRRPALCLGFGAGVYLLLWVPVLNFFFIPVAVVAGTLLYRGLTEVSGRVS